MKKYSIYLLIAGLVLGLASCADVAELPTGVAELPRWGDSYLKKDAEWYVTDEARVAADQVLAYQSSNGSWPKN